MILAAGYDNSTNVNIIGNNLKDLSSMKKEVQKMYKFCNNSNQDTETEEFLRQLKLMHNDCISMIEDLKRYL